MGKHSGPEKTVINSQQFGKHSQPMIPTVESPRGGEDKTDSREVRLAPNLDVKKGK